MTTHDDQVTSDAGIVRRADKIDGAGTVSMEMALRLCDHIDSLAAALTQAQQERDEYRIDTRAQQLEEAGGELAGYVRAHLTGRENADPELRWALGEWDALSPVPQTDET